MSALAKTIKKLIKGSYPLIAVSMLSFDYFNLSKEVKSFEKAGIDLFHLDVMDGNYVPNLSVGLPIIKSIKGKTRKPVDVHLMISNPDFFVSKFIEAGADFLSFHVETSKNPKKLLQLIRKHKVKAGLVVNANISVKKVIPFIEFCDFVLVMSVQAGFGGQKFMTGALNRIRELKKMIGKRRLDSEIEVEGGVNTVNAEEVVSAGADILVMGSAFYNSEDYVETVKTVRKICGCRKNQEQVRSSW